MDKDKLKPASEARASKDQQPCHELKTWPRFFFSVWTGTKAFEIRKDDRGFKIGDYVILKEWCPDKEAYTGRCVKKRIIYMFRGGQFGVEKGYVVMGFENTRAERATPPLDIEAAVGGISKFVGKMEERRANEEWSAIKYEREYREGLRAILRNLAPAERETGVDVENAVRVLGEVQETLVSINESGGGEKLKAKLQLIFERVGKAVDKLRDSEEVKPAERGAVEALERNTHSALTEGGERVTGKLSFVSSGQGHIEMGWYISNDAGRPFAYLVRPETISKAIKGEG